MIGFGKFGKNWSPKNSEHSLLITSTDDARLVFIDPTSEGFFEGVLGCDTENDNIKEFIEAIQEVKEAGVKPFWKPIYDPSIDGRDIVFAKGSMLLSILPRNLDTTMTLYLQKLILKIQEAERFVGFMILEIHTRYFPLQTKKIVFVGVQEDTMIAIVIIILLQISLRGGLMMMAISITV